MARSPFSQRKESNKKSSVGGGWRQEGGRQNLKKEGGGVSNIWVVLIKFYSSPYKELIKTQKIKKPSGEAFPFTILGFIIFLSYDLENCKSYDWREKESRWAWGINTYLKYF